MKDFIFNQEALKLLSNENSIATKYLTNHITEFLEVAIDNTDFKASARAYQIIRKLNPAIIMRIATGNELQMIASHIFGLNSPPKLSLNRLAQITLCCIYAIPERFPPQCGFVLQFIGFVEESSIASFFDLLLSDESQVIQTQKWLESANFGLLVAHELSVTQIIDSRPGTGSMERYHNLLEIIQHAVKTPFLTDSFSSDEVLKVILRGIYSLPPELVADTWATLAAQVNPKTAILLHDMLSTAILLIETAQNPCRTHVNIIYFVSKMVQYDPNAPSLLVTSTLAQNILQFLFMKDNYSFLQTAVFEFCQQTLKRPQLKLQTAAVLIPPLIHSNELSISLHAFTFRLLDKVLEIADNDMGFRQFLDRLPGFREFVTTKLQPHKEILVHKYGGSMQKIESNDQP